MPGPIAPSTIRAAEEAITARLAAQVQNCAIESFPSDPEAYRLLHQNGALLVAFRGARYSEPLDVGDAVQDRDLLFDVNVLSRGLANHGGAYDLIEAARLALTGYQIAGFTTPIRMEGEKFIGVQDGVWIYALTVALETIAAAIDDTELGPLLQLLTMTSDYDTTEITSA